MKILYKKPEYRYSIQAYLLAFGQLFFLVNELFQNQRAICTAKTK